MQKPNEGPINEAIEQTFYNPTNDVVGKLVFDSCLTSDLPAGSTWEPVELTDTNGETRAALISSARIEGSKFRKLKVVE